MTRLLRHGHNYNGRHQNKKNKKQKEEEEEERNGTRELAHAHRINLSTKMSGVERREKNEFDTTRAFQQITKRDGDHLICREGGEGKGGGGF